MSFALTAEQLEIRDAVARLCERFGDEYWLQKDTDGAFPHEFHRAMAEAGWLGVAMPEEYGGSGLGITEAAIVMQAVAQSGRRVQRRLGGAHEHFRAAPGRRVRQRRAEAALSAAADRRQGKSLLRGDRARCRPRHDAAEDAGGARRRRLRDLRPQDLDLDRASRRQDADPDPHDAVRGGAAPVRRDDAVLYRPRPRQGRGARDPQDGPRRGRIRTWCSSTGCGCRRPTASARRDAASSTSCTA